ncbi:MAG: MBL fold metallo-hydrolase [Bacteroidales bacterium]|nr:MBL fold metallo-hydrolase [Bacteroidales bacterium]
MIKQFTFNHFEVNTYVIVDEATKHCAIVDPAAEASFEDAQLTQYIADNGLTPVMILLTHAHVDHIAGLRQCCGHWQLPVTMHKDGRKLLRQAEAYGSVMGFAVDDMSDLPVVEIDDGDMLDLVSSEQCLVSSDATQDGGSPLNTEHYPLNTKHYPLNTKHLPLNTKIECRYVPGHCPGSMCYVLHGEKAVLTGDALFHFSIGRTDLPGGDYPTLIDYLKRRILTLPDDYNVLPGHGIPSQIGKEKKYNSFLN